MSNPMALMMLKSLVGEEQLQALEKLVHELMRTMVLIHDMDARMKAIEAAIVAAPNNGGKENGGPE